MFRRASQPNAYDEVVQKATADGLTDVPWDVLLSVWDKVNDEGESGARQCIATLQKRLQHRSANVQLSSLTLAEALVKNCGKPLHREVASKAFTETLKRMEFDRNTHSQVKLRIATLVRDWTEMFESDPSLGIMGETFDYMKAKGVSFDGAPDSPQGPTDEQLKREEEDIQRAIEASAREAGARHQGYGYMANQRGNQAQITPYPNKALPADPSSSAAMRTNGVGANAAADTSSSSFQRFTSHPTLSTSPAPQSPQPTPAPAPPKRVRALYDFDAAEEGELPLRKGDVVRVMSSAYKDWWRGDKGGRVGIFPVSYVEVLPEPSREEMIREVEAEASVFARASDIEKLLDMMRSVEAQNGNLTDNDELTELYNQCLSLRPKIVKLLDKYKERTNELVEIHRRFTEAKNEYEAMMEARYPGANMGRYHPVEDRRQASYSLPYNSNNMQEPFDYNNAYMQQPAARNSYYDYSQYYNQQQAPPSSAEDVYQQRQQVVAGSDMYQQPAQQLQQPQQFSQQVSSSPQPQQVHPQAPPIQQMQSPPPQSQQAMRQSSYNAYAGQQAYGDSASQPHPPQQYYSDLSQQPAQGQYYGDQESQNLQYHAEEPQQQPPQQYQPVQSQYYSSPPAEEVQYDQQLQPSYQHSPYPTPGSDNQYQQPPNRMPSVNTHAALDGHISSPYDQSQQPSQVPPQPAHAPPPPPSQPASNNYPQQQQQQQAEPYQSFQFPQQPLPNPDPYPQANRASYYQPAPPNVPDQAQPQANSDGYYYQSGANAQLSASQTSNQQHQYGEYPYQGGVAPPPPQSAAMVQNPQS